MLAKNLCIKLLAYGEENLKEDIIESSRMEVRHKTSVPWRNHTTFVDSWLKCVKYREIVNTGVKYPIFNLSFWDATKALLLDSTTGKESGKVKYEQDKIVNKFINKHGLQNNSLIIFTDGSKADSPLA